MYMLTNKMLFTHWHDGAGVCGATAQRQACRRGPRCAAVTAATRAGQRSGYQSPGLIGSSPGIEQRQYVPNV